MAHGGDQREGEGGCLKEGGAIGLFMNDSCDIEQPIPILTAVESDLYLSGVKMEVELCVKPFVKENPFISRSRQKEPMSGRFQYIGQRPSLRPTHTHYTETDFCIDSLISALNRYSVEDFTCSKLSGNS